MHTLKVTFAFENDEDEEYFVEASDKLLHFWRMNGQVAGSEFPDARTEKGIEVFVLAPEADSLDERFHDDYAISEISKMTDRGFSKPTVTLVGKCPSGSPVCACPKPAGFILFTTYVSLESPLRCLKCFGVVPLYRIPSTYHDGSYYDIICWKSDYQNCDHLQMNCKVGEKFALRQLLDLNSDLSRQGIEICRRIEALTKQKVFYYLHKQNGRSKKAELLRKCPGCGGEWLLKKRLHRNFDFKCVDCRLLANIASSVNY